MTKFFLLFFQSLLLATLVSCTKHSEEESAEPEVTMVDELPEDFVVPQVVWDSMKVKAPEEKKEEAKGGEGAEGGEAAAGATKEKPILYSSVKVILKEKNKGVLKKPVMAYDFSRGGGELDLATVIGSQAGSFFLSFELPEYENALQKKAFFVSQSRQRKVDGEILGSGCRKVLDVSTQIYKLGKDTGMKINTTRKRHDSILGGHMIFLAETEKNWFLTQVTFYDSSRMDLFCKGFRTIAAEVR